MSILPGTGPTFFLFEYAQLECPGRKTSEDHHYKPAVKADQGEHGPCLQGVGKKLNYLRNHLLLPLREKGRLRSEEATRGLQEKTNL